MVLKPTAACCAVLALLGSGPALAQTQGSPAAAPPATLPNGASAINETFGDWSVSCTLEDGRKSCAFSQAQGNKDTGQRAFAIELRMPAGGASAGTILMPFGPKLDAGALLKLDGKDLGQGLRFSTCVPQGCLLPVALPTVATDAMRTGKTLTVATLDLASGRPVTFDVSLKGFGQALDRINQLAP